MNGLVYRAEYANGADLAVKLSKRDDRDRAGRAFMATSALYKLGCRVTAEPLHYEFKIPEASGMSAFVCSWIPGKTLQTPPPPQDKRGWRDILYALGEAHKVKPHQTALNIPNAVMPIQHPVDVLIVLEQRRTRLPEGRIGALSSGQLDYLLHVLASSVPHEWERPAPIGLILCDPNPTNMIAHRGNIYLVDWENSGWADPAFEIGDLCAQPSYFDLPEDHRQWLRAEHGRILNDGWLAPRAEIYERMMNVFWVLVMSAQLLSKQDRLEGVHIPSKDYIAHMQLRYWERACAVLEIDPAS